MGAREISSAHGFRTDLRISARLPIATLAAVGILLGAVAERLALLPEAALVVVLLELLAGVGWLLAGRWPQVGRWFAVIVLAILVQVANGWLGAPGTLALLAIPTALAAASISVSAAAVTAGGATTLLLLLAHLGMAGTTQAGVTVALIAIWAMLGVMAAVYRPVYGVANWAWEHSDRAWRMLEEARDRRGEMKQALEDLAQANLQLTRLNHLAQGLRQVADEARLAKEQFVANVSHELRTPLNMILGFCEMMLQAPETYSADLPPALLADLEVILRNSQHLSDLIDDVLDLSQVDSGQMALTKERIALPEVVRAAATAVRPLYVSKGLSLNLEVAEDLPPIMGDRTRIREVLLNLLSNAGRFTERGGVCVRAWREGNVITVSVADTGPGIAAGDLGRIFRPFQQLDSSIRRRHGGSGLGLSISKSFVELHGGTMWMDSQKGSGTTFYFRLPIDPPVAVDGGVSRWINPYSEYDERPRRATAPVVVRPRFVVLEAGRSLQRLLRRYLEGIEILSVASMQEARQELSRVPAQALVINRPSVSEGLEGLVQGRDLPDGTPAIICSIPGGLEAAGALGAADYLVKPISRQALLTTLDRLTPEAKTVLVVDDEPEALQLFRRMLGSSGRGYRMLRATDGRQGLDILRRHRPDVLLLDLVMPEMDGFQLLAAKNADPALRDIPVVVISARDPAGQPILSNALAVTRGGGLSTSQLLACVEAISKILSPATAPADPAPRGALGG